MRLTKENQEYYLGPIDRCWLGHSADSEIRKHCASGGIVSTILVELLDAGQIDGALVFRLELTDGQIIGRSFIAISKDEILSSSGSIYFDIKPLPIAELKKFPGRLAVVGLPCHLNKLSASLNGDKQLQDKIILKIGLFCGHNSKKDLLLKVLGKKQIRLAAIKDFRFRKGPWRGEMRVTMKSREVLSFPFSHFSVYQNLHFFSLTKCLHCGDHTAENSDVSCGDVWLRKMKKEKIKNSCFLSRTKKGSEVINMLITKGAIIARNSSPNEVFLSQKRSLIHHKSLYARSVISCFVGSKIQCTERGGTRWNDYLAALISMSNARLSEKETFQKYILRVPRQILYPYLLLFKFLTNF